MNLNDIDVPEALEDTADYIEKYGWARGDGWKEQHGAPMCIEGAMAAVTGIEFYTYVPVEEARAEGLDYDYWIEHTETFREFHSCKLHETVLRYLEQTERIPTAYGSRSRRDLVWAWNDRVALDEQEILDVLRGAAKFAREEEMDANEHSQS